MKNASVLFFLSFLGTLIPGVIALTVFNSVYEVGYLNFSTSIFILISTLVDGIFVFYIIERMRVAIHTKKFTQSMLVLGGILLVILGVSYVFPDIFQAVFVFKNPIQAVFLALIFGFLNQNIIPFWVLWGSILMNKKIISQDKKGSFIAASMSLLGTFVGLCLYAYAGKYINIYLMVDQEYISGSIKISLIGALSLMIGKEIYGQRKFLAQEVLKKYIRCTNYEYWSLGMFYYPFIPVYIYYMVRTRTLGFFALVNPSFEGGGFHGYSKKAILDLIPQEYIPKTILVTSKEKEESVISSGDNTFPIVRKPDKGSRGRGVEKFDTKESFLIKEKEEVYPYILQEYSPYKEEFSVFYSKKYSEDSGIISSLTIKDFLAVYGDGESTLIDLIYKSKSTLFQRERLLILYENKKETILKKGERFELEPIGNHCRGTRFIDVTHLVNKDLLQTFDILAKKIDGFQYGRFDIRAKSFESLSRGEDFHIVELNGVGSEPVHVYDASIGVRAVYRALFWHIVRLGEIALENKKRGYKRSPSFSELKKYISYM